MIVKWREFYSETAIAAMTAMGTLPIEETDVEFAGSMCGSEVAAEIARLANAQDNEWFRESGDLVILEPERIAGEYHIAVDYEPHFYGYKS